MLTVWFTNCVSTYQFDWKQKQTPLPSVLREKGKDSPNSIAMKPSDDIT